MSFTSKIEQYVGSLTDLDLTTALAQAVDHTLGVIKARAPQSLGGFTSTKQLTTGTAWNLRDNNVFDLVKVVRDGYMCQPIGSENERNVADSSSIYYAQSYSPAYLVDYSANLKIFPAPTATNTAAAYVIYNSNGKTITDNDETIKDGDANGDERFPSLWKQYVVFHAAEILLTEIMSDFRGKLSTRVKTILDSAQDYIDTAPNSGWSSVQDWLEDEDEDMVASTLGVTAQELSMANSVLSELNQDYGWVAQQIPRIQQLKQEFLMNQGLGGASDNPGEGQI